MSAALAFTADARLDFADLEIDLQEAVLDELDRLAELPFPAAATFVADVVQQSRDARHYIFIRLAADPGRGALVILGLHHHRRQLGA